jgi:hypothetical protein
VTCGYCIAADVQSSWATKHSQDVAFRRKQQLKPGEQDGASVPARA